MKVWIVFEDYDSPYAEDRNPEIVGIFDSLRTAKICVNDYINKSYVRYIETHSVWKNIKEYRKENS